ncbi:hypothetical protein Avbf_06156 [Armadillidium vulgare]|nr:hypothetical protein Avbf_06156 [Armadillidium vulgare]
MLTRYVTKSKNFTHFITHATSSHLYYDHSHNRSISNFFLWYFSGSLFMGTLYGKVLVHRIMELGECTSLAINLMF